ncbi:MAG: RNA-binding transcriptional accessory protein [Cyclobacteriaceae bacterium]|nr:RNA-binding transcriptional accessory protein [Cyclobacteriaceae bacterium]
MKEHYISLIVEAAEVTKKQVQAVTELLEEGATIPFMARYRKERTDNLDEVKLLLIKEKLHYFEGLEQRKEYVLHIIQEQGKLTPELEKEIENTTELTTLEDIYLPYKPKRKTRATKAIEAGLEPLATLIFEQKDLDPKTLAKEYLNDTILTEEAALSGARDIIAEWISENKDVRDRIRKLFSQKAVISSKEVKTKTDDKYKDYFEFEELLHKCPSHRLLAIYRGENEGVLKTDISVEEETAFHQIDRIVLKNDNYCTNEVQDAVEDSYKRLIKPSIENEFRKIAKEKADEEAINVFRENLRQLLLSAPLGQKRTLALDPGYRTGCKMVILDQFGNLLHKDTIFPHPPQNQSRMASEKVTDLCEKFDIEAISIGNGTAGRETEEFVRKLPISKSIKIFLTNESGASIYSASETAREEFPDEDITVRGAVSIGRRLMDPLAELVKIDPKSIGVGQYQHDVDQKKLRESLDQVVESCVNLVGVDVNTASKQLLSYVSGMGSKLASNFVEFRKKNGGFSSRKDFLKVPLMGPSAFEQAAGFLRIANSENPLDSSAVHPERYELVEKMAKDQQCELNDLITKQDIRKKINLKNYITEEVGKYTLEDILNELEKPGRDPREQIEEFSFADIHSMEDLKVGMEVPGIVTNLTKFGAFVDIGVKQDGLVHISQITDKFIKDPAEVLKLQQKVSARVLEVDPKRKRISLSLRKEQ